MKKQLTLLSITLILLSCNEPRTDKKTLILESPKILVDTSFIAILPYEKRPDWIFKDCKEAEFNSNDIQDIESILIKCINEYNIKLEKQFQIPLSNNHEFEFNKKYKRQYIVVTNKKGEKEVWINCFCSTAGLNWKSKPVFVFDGGNCFFNLKINLKTRKYYDFMVNGDA